MKDKLKDNITITIESSDTTKPKHTIQSNTFDELTYVMMCKTIGDILNLPRHVINSHVFTDEELCDYIMEVESELQAAKDEKSDGEKDDSF